PLETFDFERGQRYIIKPLRGFFGTGVKEITRDTDLQKTVGEIRDELEKNAKFFTGSVLSKEEMIIEEFIDGEEYAVDMYYDSRGEPVILNITHHPKARFPEYDNVLYYTNQDIFNRLYDVATGFFKRLSPSPSITSFPIHGEFKLTSDNRFMPIELNPLRFGGFGMGDLPFYSFNINPVTAYFKDMHPNWDAVWDMHKDMNFGWVMAYNPPGVCTGSPDDREFKEFLGSSLLKYIPIDYLENPVFAICYLKSKNMEDLNKLLTLDFREYFPT
ncbi:MAG: ATP-grasp domain-containing protein, partial [bacterium]|nr:ATP-grasp domain-containing protein [bacterium]